MQGLSRLLLRAEQISAGGSRTLLPRSLGLLQCLLHVLSNKVHAAYCTSFQPKNIQSF